MDGWGEWGGRTSRSIRRSRLASSTRGVPTPPALEAHTWRLRGGALEGPAGGTGPSSDGISRKLFAAAPMGGDGSQHQLGRGPTSGQGEHTGKYGGNSEVLGLSAGTTGARRRPCQWREAQPWRTRRGPAGDTDHRSWADLDVPELVCSSSTTAAFLLAAGSAKCGWCSVAWTGAQQLTWTARSGCPKTRRPAEAGVDVAGDGWRADTISPGFLDRRSRRS